MRKFITMMLIGMLAVSTIFAEQYLFKMKVTEKPNESWTTVVIDAQTYSAFVSLFGQGKKPITKDGVTTTKLDTEKVNKFYKDLGEPVNTIDAKLVYYEFVGEKY